ncbi:hypothetical protein FISHEDRAFT_38662 [Fistulina hepatica ATCC 64428]|uniref:Pentacotripeptide-repeat region of PRORP domain-containing protein n=1 Tax=Fistulina hepatica ATCC 64428 TaxID=1128425 RepID=A0A0D7AJS0_9AGAR|nr:hypothetical protein FISHEDRAFT_38662 [Fistulina hepatica ATCC 64428]
MTLMMLNMMAHAMQGTFNELLKTFASTPMRISPTTSEPFLKNFDSTHPEAVERYKLYMERLNVASYVLRPPVLTKHIIKLTKAEQVIGLSIFYNSIVMECTRPDSFVAADPEKQSEQRFMCMTEWTWSAFLNGFLRCRRKDLAHKVWTDLGALGVSPTMAMWTTLLDSYGTLRMIDDANNVWKAMVGNHIQPDALAYRALIEAFFNVQQYANALQLFEEFQQRVQKVSDMERTMSVYNTVLRGLLDHYDLQRATTLLKRMEEHGPSPDTITYNTFLSYYSRHSLLHEIPSMIDKMAERNLAGDVFSYSIILTVLLKAGRQDASKIVLDIMAKKGVKPSVATFTALIDSQLKEQTEVGFKAALMLLDEMETKPDAQPNIVTYTSILTGIYHSNWLSPELVEQKRADIMGRIKSRNMHMGTQSYNILIRACLERPGQAGVNYAMLYYEQMQRRRVPITMDTWYLLLFGLHRRREWKMADEVVADLYKSGQTPTRWVLALIGRIRERSILENRP